WVTPARAGNVWHVPACARDCTVRYAIDLDAMAVACQNELDCAMRVGPTVLSPALAWLLHPQPKGDAPVTLRAHAADPRLFATGLSASSEPLTYRFRAPELDEGSFTAFGPMRRVRAEAPQAQLDVVVLGGPFAAMSDAQIGAWIADSARCVSTLYG